MKLVYSEQGNGHKIYQVDDNHPLVYCIYMEHKDYKAVDREDGLIYLRGFKTYDEAKKFYEEHCKL